MTYYLYFSPGGGTRKYAQSLAYLTPEHELYDLTLKREPLHLETKKEDLLVLAYPVYYGRIPSLLLEKLKDIRGNSTPAILLSVYGNRHYDDALLEGSDFLKERGFISFAGAALIAKHTYGQIQVHRPNHNDLDELKDFFKNALAQRQHQPFFFPGKNPYREKGKPHFTPYTSEDCIACKACLRACPWEAITDSIETIEEKCSACLACVDVCPMDARVLPDEYQIFAKEFSEKLKEPRENEFFL